MRERLRLGIFAALFTTVSFSASAQCNPPSSFEDSHPGVGMGIGLTGHTSAYSMGWTNTALGTANFVCSGWDDANAIQPAGVSWRFLQIGNPSGILNQGIIPYSNVRDVEVGSIAVNGSPYLMVAYYRNGAGHMLDVYDMAGGFPSYLYTNVLSTMGYYTRISMDCHKQYGMVVAWEGINGINFITGLNTFPVTYSPVLSLTGTVGDGAVDVAFTHGNGPLLLQFVYYNPNTGMIRESSFDYFVAMGIPSPQPVTPQLNDRNMVGTCKPCDPRSVPRDMPRLSVCPVMNIDAPGHYQFDNWAYTYTTDNNNISVRLLDLNTSSSAATVVVNDGSSLPAMPINNDMNVHPFLQYDVLCGGPGINVAWFTNAIDPCSGRPAGYYGLRMDATGTTLLSPPDYLTVANNPGWASMTPVLSMSKSDDMAPEFMYTIFPEFDPTAPGFTMQNKYPGYCSNSYKGAPEAEANNESRPCNDGDKIAAFKKERGLSDVTAYPNPFNTTFQIGLPVDCFKEKATIMLTDALGNTVATFTGPSHEANAYFAGKTKSLATGSYFLNITVDGKVKETLKLTKVQ